MIELHSLLLNAGLLQFGYFEAGKPYKLYLDLLPSYPVLLDALISAAAPRIEEVDHLLSTTEAMPLGVGLSLRTNIPLVYSRGTGEAPVYDLVGAYDIGHPALLLATQPTSNLDNLIANAQIVGLDIRSILVIVDDGVWQPATLPMQALVHLPTVINALAAQQAIPAGQAQMVQGWINRHQGSAAP